MIGSLRGTVIDRSGTELLVEVAGLGYRVQVTPTAAAALPVNDDVFLHVHHHSREDAEVLYGFTTLEERKVFETLIGTHGVGPALGQAILSVHDPVALSDAVANDDSAALCLVPGVGRKTAARLLVELKSRLVVADIDVSDGGSLDAAGANQSVRGDVREALVGLGYGGEEIAGVLSDLPEGADSGEALREALKRLAVA
ncbi:MAG: Holliday junction branch migration protein RuvA [Actinomycetia bacterium]|nr:Holliday junction branch migration protein RuvA [Actinomycetes bacterium]